MQRPSDLPTACCGSAQSSSNSTAGSSAWSSMIARTTAAFAPITGTASPLMQLCTLLKHWFSGSDVDSGSGLGSGGGGTGGRKGTTAGDPDSDPLFQGIQAMGGLCLFGKSTSEHPEVFETSVRHGVGLKKCLQEETCAWNQSNPDGATVVFFDASALAFLGGIDDMRRYLHETCSGIPNLFPVVSFSPTGLLSVGASMQNNSSRCGSFLAVCTACACYSCTAYLTNSHCTANQTWPEPTCHHGGVLTLTQEVG